MTWHPFCLIGWHGQTYRERRPIAGVSVNHLVCQACGYAEPVLERSEAEYLDISRAQLPALKAKPKTVPSAADKARAAEKAKALESVRPFRRIQ